MPLVNGKVHKDFQPDASVFVSQFAFFQFCFRRCKCGNCNTSFLVNISECYCCRELDGCVESLESDIVQDDLKEQISSEVRSAAPNEHEMCITRHPGFDAVCLQKWSLRLASGKFGTKSGHRYRQTDTEER